MKIFGCLLVLAFLPGAGFCAQPEIMLWPYSGTSVSVASANGKALAIPSLDGKIKVFKFSGAAVSMISLDCINRPTSVFALSDDGRILAAYVREGKILIFDLASGAILRELRSSISDASQIIFSKDGKILAMVQGAEVNLVDSATGKRIGGFKPGKDMLNLALANKDKWLKYSSSDKGVEYPANPWSQDMKAWAGIRSVWVSPDAKFLAYGYEPKLLDLSSGRSKTVAEAGKERIEYVAFSGDSQYMAVVRQFGMVNVWDLKAQKQTAAFNWREDNPMTDHELSRLKLPRGLFFVNGSKDLCIISEAGPIEIWDIGNRKKVKTLTPNVAAISSLALLPQKHRLLASDGIGFIRMWDLAKGAILKKWSTVIPGWPVKIAVSKDEQYLFYSDDNALWAVLYDLEKDKKILEITAKTQRQHKINKKFVVMSDRWSKNPSLMLLTRIGNAPIETFLKDAVKLENAVNNETSYDFSPDGKYLAYALNNGAIKVIDPAQKTEVQKLAGLKSFPWTVGYSDDGKFLIGADIGGKVVVWDTDNWKKLAELNGFESYAYNKTPMSSDGRFLAGPEAGVTYSTTAFTADYDSNIRNKNKRLKLVDNQTQKKLSFEEPGNPHLVFSPDSKYLAALPESGGAKVWDTVSGSKYAELPTTKIFSVVFADNGRTLFTGGADGAIRVYALPSGDHLLTLTAFNNDEWIISLPNGKYNSSSGAAKYMKLEGFSGKSLLKKLATEYYSPQEISAALTAI